MDIDTGLLLRFPTGDLLVGFACFDHARHQFQHPRGVVTADSADAELLQQHELIAHRVPGKHPDGVAAFEQLPGQGLTPATAETPVTQGEATNRVVAAERVGRSGARRPPRT